MRILCIIPTMGPGGAERTMANLVTHLAKCHAVTLLTFDKPNAASFYLLPSTVEYLRIDKFGSSPLRRLWKISSRSMAIRRIVRSRTPDVVISFMDTTNLTVVAACLGLGVPTLISERIDPAKHRIGWAKDTARRYIYPFAHRVIVQTSRVASRFPTSLQAKIRIIGNPAPVSTVLARPSIAGSAGRLRIVAVGRYEPQKGFDRLIEAFAIIASDYPDWDLTIFGDGSERPRLEARVKRLGLESRIALKSTVKDIFPELAASHLMACPSRYEGFPNALVEGLAAGLPAVGFRGVSGVEELIVDGTTGKLVDDEDGAAGYAKALSVLMADAGDRSKLSEAALAHLAHWAPDRIFALWDDLIAEATARTR